MRTLQSLEVLNAIDERRAIRRYSARAVTREAIEQLVEAAIQAPSAMNEQPWAFAVALGAERLSGYSDRATAELDGATAHLVRPGDNIFHGAPALIVICATSAERQAAEDCCLAAQNLMLAAFALGLGTCPIGLSRPWLSLAQTKRELGIPDEFVPIFPVVVGWPDERPETHGRRPPRVIWA